MESHLKFFVGYDRRFPNSYAVTCHSIRKRSTIPVDIAPLFLPRLMADGLYTRPTVFDEVMWDKISDAPMSTEFAISRFLIAHLCDYKGWAVFCDNDFMFLADPAELLELANPWTAVQCVHHNYVTTDTTKMEGQPQTQYPRKNWSSLMLVNCGHPANRILNPALVNKSRGIELHAFHWLPEELVGSLPEPWNWLEGHSDPALTPKAVHFTRGVPDMKGHEDVVYAEEWRTILREVEDESRTA